MVLLEYTDNISIHRAFSPLKYIGFGKADTDVKAGRDQKQTNGLKEQSKPDKRKKRNPQFVNQAKSKHHKKEVKLKHSGTSGQWHKDMRQTNRDKGKHEDRPDNHCGRKWTYKGNVTWGETWAFKMKGEITIPTWVQTTWKWKTWP